MKTKNYFLKVLFTFSILLSFANYAEALNVDPFEYFNVYSLGNIGQEGDYYGSTDIQGTIGVAGNAYLRLTTGDKTSNDYALHTGGNLAAKGNSMGGKFDIGGSATISNYGIIYDIHSGGKVDLTGSGSGSAHVYAKGPITKTANWGIPDGNLHADTPYTPMLDFDALNQYFLDTSTAIGAMTPTGTANSYYTTLSFNVVSGVNVFNVNISDLYDTETSIKINGPSDAIVYINALDETGTMDKNMKWFYNDEGSEVSPHNVLLNFANATELHIKGGEFNVLAPKATVTFSDTIIGNLIAGDLPQGNQVNLGYFDTPEPVPEPSTFMLLGTAMAGMFVFRKKLRKQI